MSELSKMVEDIISAKSKEGILKNIMNILEPTTKVQNIKELANESIANFKDLNADEADLISGLLEVTTIKDLANASYKKIINNLSLLRDGGIEKKKLELIITAAKYIIKAADYKPVEGQKIVVVGLDNAGKTALLNAIKKEVGVSKIAHLKPTKGVVRSRLYLKDLELYISELGGQKEYRKAYLEEPEKYVLATDCLVFMIDVQDEDRYQEALDYLKQILRIVKFLQESPEFVVLLHKSDPDIIPNEVFQEKIGYLIENVKGLFKPYVFQHEILTTSIYNIFGMGGGSFASMLKGLLSGELLEEKRKVEAMAKLMDTIVDLVLTQEATLTEEIDLLRHNLFEVNRVVRKLTQKAGIDTDSAPIPELESPKVKTPATSYSRGKGIPPHSELLKEIKRLFVKRG